MTRFGDEDGYRHWPLTRLARRSASVVAVCVVFGATGCAASEQPVISTKNPSSGRHSSTTVVESTTAALGPPVPIEPTDVAMLAAAFDTFDNASSVRTLVSMGSSMNVPALDIDTENKVDTDRPTLMTETAANGDAHAVTDLSKVAPAAASARDLTIEQWRVGDQLVIDTRSLTSVPAGPELDRPNPLAPGLISVDLAQLDPLDGAAVLGQVPGDGANPRLMSEMLLPNLVNATKRSDGDKVIVSGTVPLSDWYRATGDVPAVRASMMSLSSVFGADPESQLQTAYLEVFDESAAVVELEVDGGIVSTVRMHADITPVIKAIVGGGPRAEELADGASMVIDAAVRFEADDTISVTLPPGPYEDRTNAFKGYAAWLGIEP